MIYKKINPVGYLSLVLGISSTLWFSVTVSASDTVYGLTQNQNLSTIVLGDLDGDVTLIDDKLFKEFFAGKDDMILNPRIADINKDGFITRKDAIILSRHLAGWEGYSLSSELVNLPWEELGAKQPSELYIIPTTK